MYWFIKKVTSIPVEGLPPFFMGLPFDVKMKDLKFVSKALVYLYA